MTITFLQIFFVCLLGAMSPGPSMVVVINNAIFKNRFNGILTSIGHGIGIGFYAIFAVIGIGYIIETSPLVFEIIKIISIFFLAYLGINSLLSREKLDLNDKRDIRVGVKSFLQGFGISILNPKIFIWFVAIYSQFMSESNNLIMNSFLVIIASLVDTIWYIFLTFLVTSNKILEYLRNKTYILNKIIGIIFITISFILLLKAIF